MVNSNLIQNLVIQKVHQKTFFFFMKLPNGINNVNNRIRIKTFSNSSAKQNKIVETRNNQTIEKNSLQKLKILPKNFGATNFSEIAQQKVNLTKRLSINGRKTTQATQTNLLRVENFKKQNQSSSNTLSNHPSPYKGSQTRKSTEIMNLLMHQKQDNSVSDVQQQKVGIINSSNKNQISKNLIFENANETLKSTEIVNKQFQKRIFPEISLPYKTLGIHFQFQLSINEGQSLIKKEASIQTFCQAIQDDIFFNEYAKYKAQKGKYLNMLTKKKQKIDQMIKQQIKFEKDYQNLISSVNEPPSNIREKRVLSLAKDLEQAEKKFTNTFNKINQMWNQMNQMINQQTKKTLGKKKQLETSIQNLCNVQIILLELQQKQNTSEKRTQRIFKRIISQFKYLLKMDNNNLNLVNHFHKKYHGQVSELQTFYKQWKDLMYENRVLLYNFMKQIQKIPLVMTEIFGFGQVSNEGYLGLDKCLMPCQNLMKCCQDCYGFKKNVRNLQVWNSQLKPIFKTIEWLIRNGDKKKQCIQLI